MILNNYKYVVRSKSFRPDKLFKLTEMKKTLLFFNAVSLYFDTNFHVCGLVALCPSKSTPGLFPFGVTFVCQAGKFVRYYIHIRAYVITVAYPGILFGGGRGSSTNSAQDRRQRGWRTGEVAP
jgi:hypothetical protein